MSEIILENIDCMLGMARYPDKYFELAIVDPPYGINVNMDTLGKRIGEIRKYRQKDWDLSKPHASYFSELLRASEKQIIWGANNFHSHLLENYGWIVWDKELSGNVPFSQAELAWTSFESSVRIIRIRVQSISDARIHPTQKPVKLYEWLLKNYAKQGDKILDTHLGSGSIAIACYNLDFDLVGFEIDKDYYDGACKRLEEHKKQQRLFECPK